MVSQINDGAKREKQRRKECYTTRIGWSVSARGGGGIVGYVQKGKEQIETGQCGGAGGNRTSAARMRSAQEKEREQQEGTHDDQRNSQHQKGSPFVQLVGHHESSLPGLSQLLVQGSSASASWLDRITPSKYIITIPSLSLRLCCGSPLVRLRKQELWRATWVRGKGRVLDGELRPSRGRDGSVRNRVVQRVVELPTDTSKNVSDSRFLLIRRFWALVWALFAVRLRDGIKRRGEERVLRRVSEHARRSPLRLSFRSDRGRSGRRSTGESWGGPKWRSRWVVGR